jgi:hypothetical protein
MGFISSAASSAHGTPASINIPSEKIRKIVLNLMIDLLSLIEKPSNNV